MLQELSLTSIAPKCPPQIPKNCTLLFRSSSKIRSPKVLLHIKPSETNAARAYPPGDFVRSNLPEQIEKHLPRRPHRSATKTSGPHVVALIRTHRPSADHHAGQTRRESENCAKKRRVGLITLDTYRIAAIDQLKKNATSRLAAAVVSTSEDLVAASAQCRIANNT